MVNIRPANLQDFAPADPRQFATGHKRRPHLVDNTLAVPCKKCGDPRLVRRHRSSPVHWLLSWFQVYPYQCAKCFCCQLKFMPSLKLLQPLVFAVLLAGNIGLIALKVRSAGASDAAVMPGVTSVGGATAGGLTPFERMMLSRKKQTLRNEDVVLLLSSGAESALVIKMIGMSNGVYDLSPRGVLQLKQAHVDDVVIGAMMDHSLSAESGNQ